MSNTQYYFLPSVRLGLAAAIGQSESAAHRAQIDIVLRATARKKGAHGQDSEDIQQSIQLYGPGDILGFHERIILRHHPECDVGDFEPNYFPSIEFADADFAWRFTADKADGQTGRLTPWIALIVLVSEAQGDIQPEFVEGARGDRNLPRHIIVNRSALPDLQHAWRWAHVHMTGEAGLVKPKLEEILCDEPESAISRLLCPRRLATKTRYAAFVVPTFKLGVNAGRGYKLDPDTGALEPAWHGDDRDKDLRYFIRDDNDLPDFLRGEVCIELPYYYHWEFRTGLRGDFEHLVRLLEPRKLSGLGIRNINCERPGFHVPGVNRAGLDVPESHYLGREGALQSVDTQYTQWGRDPANEPAQAAKPLQFGLANLLNKPQADQAIQQVSPNVTETTAINDIAVSILPSGTAVRIAWHTSKATTSHIDYGETTEYDRPPRHDSELKQDHALTLTDLASNTTYHFRIVTQADDGTAAETPDCTFEMPSLPSVVPPIYGRWHFGRWHAPEKIVDAEKQEAWLDVLNLDPRHRAAAGLGSEVIRKQQEPLMASAWEQLGAIESANDVLRRAQFGRESSIWLHQRLGHLLTEDFLRVTSPAQKRIIVDDGQSGKKMTAMQYLRTQSRIPAAAFDPALRRIMWARGPIRKRQGAGRSVDLLTRLASGKVYVSISDGELEKDLNKGVIQRLKNIFKEKNIPLSENIVVTKENDNKWMITDEGKKNIYIVRKEDGKLNIYGKVKAAGPAPKPLGTTRVYNITQRLKVWSDAARRIPWGEAGGFVDLGIVRPAGSVAATGAGTAPLPCRRRLSGMRFCDGFITRELIQNKLQQYNPFEVVPDAPNPQTMVQIVCDTLDGWLDKQPEEGEPEPPTQPAEFVDDVRNVVFPALDPNRTVVERTKKRLWLAGDLVERFDEGAKGDPLDAIMWAPEFPQPMYEPLRDISHDLLLPGVDSIPQNTLGLLQTNRRFLESYMCGCNHEFAGELLWRGYPTDQRGSYFRQFWDVSGYVSRDDELQSLLFKWLVEQGVCSETDPLMDCSVANLPMEDRRRILKKHFELVLNMLLGIWLAQTGATNVNELPETQKQIIKKLEDDGNKAVSEIPEVETNKLVTELVKQERLDEKLRDITALVEWGNNRLGENKNQPGEDLVLVVRGDLMKRYPNALIYAIDAVPCDGVDGEPVPGLPEYLKDSNGDPITDPVQIQTILNGIRRVFPVFRVTLPPDLTFFSFPFSKEDARGVGRGLGKFFIIEEQVLEPRFGLDMPTDALLKECKEWDDLSWTHFGLQEAFGGYLDEGTIVGQPEDNSGKEWNDDDTPEKPASSSATRAWITLQKPVRIAVHAKQMLPHRSSVF